MPSITAAALQYVGKWTYVFGGIPDPPITLVGDCSSFVTTVLSEADTNITLPGGGHWGQPGYPPLSHGPDVADYIAWDGAEDVTYLTARPGDLVLWGPNGHIGIYLGPNSMVSALNPSLGVRKGTIFGAGPGGGSPTNYRRVRGVDGGTGSEVPGAGGVDVQAAWDALFPKLSFRDFAVPAVVALVAVAGGVLLVGLLYMGGVALAGYAASQAGTAAAGAVTARVREYA